MTNTLEGIILNKENRAENFISFTLFSKDIGICYAMIKMSKSKHIPLPDLFNEISIEANKANSSNTYFIKSINNIDCINNFTKNYKAFIEATKLAQCLIKNAPHLEDFTSPYQDFTQALKAYINAKDPRIINIKWLYKLSKREGYPIKEDFATKLPLPLQNPFVNIIKLPSNSCEINNNDLDYIYNNLSIWINNQTDIIY